MRAAHEQVLGGRLVPQKTHYTNVGPHKVVAEFGGQLVVINLHALEQVEVGFFPSYQDSVSVFAIRERYLIAETFELRPVELVHMVNFLQANNASVVVLYLHDDAFGAIVPVFEQGRINCLIQPIIVALSVRIRQDIVREHSKLESHVEVAGGVLHLQLAHVHHHTAVGGVVDLDPRSLSQRHVPAERQHSGRKVVHNTPPEGEETDADHNKELDEEPAGTRQPRRNLLLSTH